MATTSEPPKTAKRDFLRALEGPARTCWNEAKAFEANAPTLEEHANADDLHTVHPKFMATMPFPYMNGRLHLGHAFTFSKVEFAASYERMKGKRTLLPQGFHCTGMPIKACADKLKREIELFGENFERYEEMALANQLEEKATVNKKSKVAAKTGNVTYQFQIMLQLDIPREEIKLFADPYYWTEYFPPQTMKDLDAFGAKVDWRRSFLTTDANLYFDSFVRWQMNKLHADNKIKFGERCTIYSPKDQQPCMDHDRQSGEAVGPQEYTAIKMEVLNWSEAAQDALKDVEALKGKKVYLVAATLRPETMYGQTNCFVGTDITYGIFQVNATEAYLCTHRAARNMAHQKIFTKGESDKPVEHLFDKELEETKLAEIKGDVLIGTKINAPLSKYKEGVYVLPMENVLPTKGTGVVTSVPSDSPDDYATFQDLKKKHVYYKVKPEWLEYDVVPVISTPNYGNIAAKTLCEQKKITSQKDCVQLAEAKELAYKEGFYKGTLIEGEYAGMAVQDAKLKVRDLLIENKDAFVYNEPESLVMSRSSDECVVALMDQWYLDYGETEWRKKAELALSRMETFTLETRHQFEKVLDWLNQWACARSFGLGTKLPWDKEFLVESLSDSTIYMAYYTVAHLLHENSVNGKKIGPAGITVDQMTDKVWDYVFKLGEYPSEEADVPPKATLDRLRREFEYFYPLDVRCSGKDLIPNHLTFFIYNHTAMFPEEMWPKAVRSNGHLMLDSKKMSKSTGNFMTLSNAIEKYGADATRFALADAGDSGEDANFEDVTANAAILRLDDLCEKMKDYKSKLDKNEWREGEFNVYDRVFENEMNYHVDMADKAYAATLYRDALMHGVYEFINARDVYINDCANVRPHKDMMKRYMEFQTLTLTPICPHVAEHVWRDILMKDTLAVNERFPTSTKEVDPSLRAGAAYVQSVIKSVRTAETAAENKKKKGKAVGADYKADAPKALQIVVATELPQWQSESLKLLEQKFDSTTNKVDVTAVREALAAKGLKNKKVMAFAMDKKKLVEKDGAEALNSALVFDEWAMLSAMTDRIKQSLKFHTLTLHKAQEDCPTELAQLAENALPGAPTFNFWNVESGDLS